MQYSLTLRLAVFFFVASLFVIYSGFTFPSTEIYMYRTLLSGKLFFMYSDVTWDFYDPIVNEGRLQLLIGMPQNLALLFTQTPSVFSVYLIQALLVFIVCLIMTFIFKEVGFDNKYAFYSILILVFSKAFVFSFYHPVLAETLLIVFLGAAILFYLRYTARPTPINLLWLVLFTMLACVTKVSAAFMLCVFAMSMVFSDVVAAQRIRHRFIAHATLIGISMMWYVFSGWFAGGPNDPLVWDIRYLQLTWATDAVVFMFVVPAGIVLPAIGLWKKRGYRFGEQVCAGLCLTAAVYAVLLVLFGKHSDYHLAPTYFLAAFAGPMVVHFLLRTRGALAS